ncbi:class I SAM-dependent methyltransferase [Desulforamulus hydrothermalis]|uniref:Methyltransferase type 11 n=1 Tax=Desulforamulus hydrothermalis Lam5 = DSM 18033 TaxID=1121428 RepID=K8EF74_9FIRM|nr:class I SAM-dependent methyltransferase [Desulforamulus hydrothermalis]CCO07351.1 Methyltransferase type 11 [Desulforamulus hydrothermalis Lam5 = DSM 18033]SHG94682.1 ubiE/COQ5 methyltransferase family protein [Desulforamulus hydrothermalis Lam5 = DSM 18033]
MGHVFDTRKMAKLDNPRRKELIPPDQVLQLLQVREGEVMLDVGCGIGYLTLPAARRVGPGGFVYGLDIQETMLVEALARSKQLALKNIAWVLTAPDYISLPDASVDCVTMVMVAHEVPDLAAMLKECRRVMRPGARIGIVEWNNTFTEMGPPLEERLKADDLLSAMQQQGFSCRQRVELSPAACLYMAVWQPK